MWSISFNQCEELENNMNFKRKKKEKEKEKGNK